MSTEIKVPVLPESVSDAAIAVIHKKVGDAVAIDENLLDLETDKVMLEVPAAVAGVVEEIVVQEGDVVTSDQLLMRIAEGATAATAAAGAAEDKAEVAGKDAEKSAKTEQEDKAETDELLSPSVRRLLQEKGLSASAIKGTGKGGRISKEDVEKHLSAASSTVGEPEEVVAAVGSRHERRVPLSRLRARIAERLVEVQHNSAMLTTFNEVNMQPVMDLRKNYKDLFEKKHGVRLGFMSFFVKACVEALRRFPAVNSYIDGNEIIYHDYCDVGIAVGTDRGLVVPILRNSEDLSMAKIEQGIRNYAAKARDGKLTLEEMTGGTFTITNGGVYGSMLSTPIINAPQSAILGMHNIVERPWVEDGNIVVRPVMYLALSYDHRIIDGKDSVSFLVTVKQLLEDPSRLLLEV